MPNVYIINKGGHDHSDAERFGDLVFLSTGTINRYAVSQMFRQFINTLAKSDPSDHILITGLTVMSVVACAIFAAKHSRLNLLLYKSPRGREQGHYVERTLMLEDI
uniref:CRISPR-associated protein n=1 Tax=viral metagenome TaxID=1070528 RepID=A0A6M3L6Z2_9ZZZZ